MNQSRTPRRFVNEPAGDVISAITTAEYTVIAALFLSVALVFSPSIETQFTLPKLLCLRLASAGLAIVWASRCRRGDLVSPPSSVLVAAAALIGWWVVTLPLAIHLPTALWGLSGRYNGVVNDATFMLLFLAIASFAMNTRGVLRIARLLVVALIPAAVYAIAQGFGIDAFAWPNPRPGSTFGHPVPLAASLALALPFAVALAVRAETRRERRAWIGAGALLLFAIGTTLSRGPWFGGGAALVVLFVGITRRRVIAPVRAIVFASIIVLLTAATVLVGRVQGTRVTQRIAQLSHVWTDPSFANRFVYLRAAVSMIRTHPVAGSGHDSFALLYPKFRPVEGDAVPDDALPSMVHNGYVQRAVEGGVPGLVLYLVLIGAIVLGLGRPVADAPIAGDETMRWAALAALSGFLVQDLSGWPELSSSTFFWAVAGLAMGAASVAGKSSRTDIPRGASVLGYGVAFVMLVLAASTVQQLRADRAIFVARHRDVIAAWPETSALALEAVRLAPGDGRYLDEAAVLHLQRMYAAGGPDAYARGTSLADRAIAANAFNPYALVHRVDFESAALRAGLVNRPASTAEDAVRALLALDPRNASARESIARLYLSAGDVRAAMEQITVARALRPSRPGTRILEGDIRRAAGDRNGALAAYREETTLHAGPTPEWQEAQLKLTAMLLQAGDFMKAAQECDRLLARFPSNPQALALADAVRQAGR